MLTQNRKYRSTTEIFHDILRVAGNEGYDGAGKTQIMYNAFSHIRQLKNISPF
jgi:predicted transcriptional regulator